MFGCLNQLGFGPDQFKSGVDKPGTWEDEYANATGLTMVCIVLPVALAKHLAAAAACRNSAILEWFALLLRNRR